MQETFLKYSKYITKKGNRITINFGEYLRDIQCERSNSEYYDFRYNNVPDEYYY